MNASFLNISFIFFFIVNLTLLSGVGSAQAIPEIKKGVLDLRGDKLNEFSEISFAGEWEFYWSQLLDYTDFRAEGRTELTCYELVPSEWNEIQVNGQHLQQFGYATYRLEVLTDTVGIDFALRMGSIATASKIFVDSLLVFASGIVSKDKEKGMPEFSTGVISFKNKIKKFDLIVQVSNYHYAKGGIWSNQCKIGKSEYVVSSWQKKLELKLFMLGAISIIAIYFLGLFLFNRNMNSALYFGLFCVVILFRALVIDEIYLLRLFPDFNWFALVRIEYLTIPIGIIAISLFLKDMLKFFSFRILKIIVLLALFSCVPILFTPVSFFTQYVKIYQILIILVGVYSIYILIYSLSKKDKIAAILLVGIVILLASIINDILYVNKVIQSMYLTTFGFIIFILNQAYLLSFRFFQMYSHVKSLSHSLEKTNLNLEKTIRERTEEIHSQNMILIEQNDKITSQRDHLELQHQIVQSQKKVITDSINYAQKIQKAVLPSRNTMDLHLKDHFILYKPKDIVSGDFYWFTEKNDKLVVVAADCTGHGVPGAFMSMLGIAFLGEIIKMENVNSAAQILGVLRERVKHSLRQYSKNSMQREGIDMAICIFDPDTNILEFSGAYSPLYMIRNNMLHIFKGDRQPVAIHIKETTFKNQYITVQPEDVFYIFTDGFIDQIGGADKRKFRPKHFKDLLLKIHKLPLDEQKNLLEKTLNVWMGENMQIDDILVVGLKFFQ